MRNRISLDEARTAFDRIASKRNWLDAEIYQHAKRYLDAIQGLDYEFKAV